MAGGAGGGTTGVLTAEPITIAPLQPRPVQTGLFSTKEYTMKLRCIHVLAIVATALLTGCASVREVQSTVQSYSTLGALPAPPTYRLDRKSTCLNSSHQIISYAVFCLKKKNIIG